MNPEYGSSAFVNLLVANGAWYVSNFPINKLVRLEKYGHSLPFLYRLCRRPRTRTAIEKAIRQRGYDSQHSSFLFESALESGIIRPFSREEAGPGSFYDAARFMAAKRHVPYADYLGNSFQKDERETRASFKKKKVGLHTGMLAAQREKDRFAASRSD